MSDLDSVGFLDEKLGNEIVAGELLPVFHSCDAFWARSIINQRKIMPLKCEVFKEDLAYLFYGRPAYKNASEQSSNLKALFPVSFIIKSNNLPIKRIAAFDTGAFANKVFEDYMHNGMRIEDFLLSPDLKVIPKFIHHFFESNEAYYEGRPRPDVHFDAMNFEFDSYLELIQSGHRQKADDRKASIEIQIDQELIMDKFTVEAIVIPSHLKSSSYVQETVLKEWGAEVITYTTYGVPSKENYTLLLHLVREYMVKQKYLYD